MYYGLAMICRSYTVLFAGLFAHLLQLLFLVGVEEPHIQRTYGSPDKVDADTHKVLYDPQNGLFPHKKVGAALGLTWLDLRLDDGFWVLTSYVV
jgi:hypothetical protein